MLRVLFASAFLALTHQGVTNAVTVDAAALARSQAYDLDDADTYLSQTDASAGKGKVFNELRHQFRQTGRALGLVPKTIDLSDLSPQKVAAMV